MIALAELDTFHNKTLEKIVSRLKISEETTLHVVGMISSPEYKFLISKVKNLKLFEWRQKHIGCVEQFKTRSKFHFEQLDFEFQVPTELQTIKHLYFANTQSNPFTLSLWVLKLLEVNANCMVLSVLNKLFETDVEALKGYLNNGQNEFLPIYQYELDERFELIIFLSHFFSFKRRYLDPLRCEIRKKFENKK